MLFISHLLKYKHHKGRIYVVRWYFTHVQKSPLFSGKLPWVPLLLVILCASLPWWIMKTLIKKNKTKHYDIFRFFRMEFHCLGQLLLITENLDWAFSEVLQLTLECIVADGTSLCRIWFSNNLIPWANSYNNPYFVSRIIITFIPLLHFKTRETSDISTEIINLFCVPDTFTNLIEAMGPLPSKNVHSHTHTKRLSGIMEALDWQSPWFFRPSPNYTSGESEIYRGKLIQHHIANCNTDTSSAFPSITSLPHNLASFGFL